MQPKHQIGLTGIVMVHHAQLEIMVANNFVQTPACFLNRVNVRVGRIRRAEISRRLLSVEKVDGKSMTDPCEVAKKLFIRYVSKIGKACLPLFP
jgi:hypothetical protein